MNLLLDTNIILLLVRSKDFDGMLRHLNPEDVLMYVSVVTEAEIKSIALQNNWGGIKRDRLDFSF